MSASVVPEVLKGSRMSEETVKALSSFKDEPGWLTEKRLGAWRAFEALPMPTLRDEAWRYTEISALLVQHNSETTYERMDAELQNKGVVFTDLHTALRKHEDLIREKLFGLVPEDYDKFSALSAALFAGGSFLYVPRG